MTGIEYSAEERQLRQRAKGELRKRMKMTRDALPAEARRLRSQRIANAVVAMSEFQAAQTIAAYSAIQSEADVVEVVEQSWTDQKIVAFPRANPETKELVFHRVEALDDLRPGAHGIPEPVESAPVIEKSNIDFALVPALAVDANGFRIGYGGGYYDRALPHLVNAFSCVVAYGFQVISEVPLFSDDAAVDAIVTDTAIIYVER